MSPSWDQSAAFETADLRSESAQCKLAKNLNITDCQDYLGNGLALCKYLAIEGIQQAKE
jgi:hypothetical protein